MKEYKVRMREVVTKTVDSTHIVQADTPEQAELFVRAGKAHTRYESPVAGTETRRVVAVKWIKEK